MASNIIDFDSSKNNQLLKRKDVKVESMREAFKQSREEAANSKLKVKTPWRKKRKKK